jgi:hypothetical protein
VFQVTVALALPGVALAIVGADGTTDVRGIAVCAVLNADAPPAFAATTANAYCVPFVNPVTCIVVSLPDIIVPFTVSIVAPAL